ncbi:MAG: ABC transporter ATP-binding protein [Desulfobacterota bacterium]|jgi:putative ABC transport system ATP-binding protein|nr:ABC transporter ATP-binding protein [Thermodesulfobacteriota bacterium]
MSSLIKVTDLCKTYQVGEIAIQALGGVTLAIDTGEFVSIMGSSGSGKSTFMNILGCLDVPTGGSYFLDGESIETLSRDELARIRNQKIGFVFQGFNLLARTSALENVELPLIYSAVPARDRRRMALEALQAVGLEGRGDHHPNQLSGGQQQRVAVARALVNRPAIILADEPTGNLDTRTSVEIMQLLNGLNAAQKITIVLVTHEQDIAAFTRRKIVFTDGQVLEDQLLNAAREDQ